MTLFPKPLRFLSLALLLGLAPITDGQAMVVATYNIRYANPGDVANGNGWEQRCPVIANLIASHDFDIFGLQEVLHKQLTDLLEKLPDYTYVGVGRDDGKEKGEYAPILYKKKRFQLLKSGYFWLSENPDRPGKGWDAAHPRICTWGEFQDLQTGLSFWFCNTHLDQKGKMARTEGAGLILKRMGEMCGGDPVILTGDFNADENSEVYKFVRDSGKLRDAYEFAELRHASTGTSSHFDPTKLAKNRIDHIFTTASWKVERYDVLTDTYPSVEYIGGAPGEKPILRVPSDHYPVMVVLQQAK